VNVALRSLGLVVAFALGIGVVILAGGIWSSPQPDISAPEQISAVEEVVLLLFASPTCAASNHPHLPAAWNALVDQVRAQVGDSVAVRTIGIAIAADARLGFTFLERFGPFHEVSSGGGLRNHGALRYLGASDMRGPQAVPQIVVVRRRFETGHDGGSRVSSEDLVRRHWGLDDIFSAAAFGG